MMNYLNIRYVILHNEYMNEERTELMVPLLRSISRGEPRVYGNMSVYEVKDQPGTQFLSLNDGWFDKENWTAGGLTRWMGEDASIIAVTTDSRKARLSFSAQSFNIPRTMEISVNGEPSGKAWAIGTDFIQVDENISLKKGTNLIDFHSREGGQRPADVPSLNSADKRLLAFAVRNITVDMSH
jgi:hypothetical protein